MQRDSIIPGEETDVWADVGTQSAPTRYADYGEMYCENTMMNQGSAAFDADFGADGPVHTWPGTVAIAGTGLATSLLLAVLTLGMVRSTDPVEATPPTPAIHSVTTVPAERELVDRGAVARQHTQTVTIAPTSARPETATVGPTPHQPVTITVTTSEAPPATMTNPLEPPPATMTNPLEPPIGASGEPTE